MRSSSSASPGSARAGWPGWVRRTALDDGMATLRGRVGAIGTMVAFRPFTEALLSLIRRGEMPAADGLGPYRQVLGRLVPDWDDGTAHDTATSTVVLGEAVLRLLALVGKDRGCLLVLEDLHGSDPETLAVVEYLLDNLEDQPITLVATLRSETCAAYELARLSAQRGSAAWSSCSRWTGSEVGELAAELPGGAAGAAYPMHWSTNCGGTAPESLSSLRNCCRRRAGPDSCCPGRTAACRSSTACRRTFRQPLSGASAAGPISSDHSRVTCWCWPRSIGHRFPLSVVRKATGTDERLLLATLRAGLAAQLVGPDEPVPDWYAFRHPLTADALLAGLDADRAGHTRHAVCGRDRGAAPRAAG